MSNHVHVASHHLTRLNDEFANMFAKGNILVLIIVVKMWMSAWNLFIHVVETLKSILKGKRNAYSLWIIFVSDILFV